MTTEALIQVPQSAVAETGQPSMIDAMTSGGKFLPRVQYMTSQSKCVKRKEFPCDHYAFVISKSKQDDLGEEFDCLVLAMRPKALDTSDPDGVITCYDMKLDEGKYTGTFKDIADRSFETDSGCMFGPEYLIWVPAKKRFATVFFCSQTARNESPAMQEKIGMAATMGGQLIEGKKHEWMAMEIKECTTVFDLPNQEEVTAQCNEFLNPEVDGSGVEIVGKDEDKSEDADGEGRVQ